MRRILAMLLALASLLVASRADARPDRGFNTGPYIDLAGGLMQANFDHNQVTGAKAGDDFEPTFGILFGWNVIDSLSAEVQARYSTNRNEGQRLHIAGINAYAKWMPIFDIMTDFPTLRILPFIKGGLGATVSVLPGADATTKITTVGFGPSVGGGIAFIWKKYVHFGIDVQEDLLFFADKRQTVGGISDTLVYKGGFYPLFSAMGFIGVHY